VKRFSEGNEDSVIHNHFLICENRKDVCVMQNKPTCSQSSFTFLDTTFIFQNHFFKIQKKSSTKLHDPFLNFEKVYPFELPFCGSKFHSRQKWDAFTKKKENDCEQKKMRISLRTMGCKIKEILRNPN